MKAKLSLLGWMFIAVIYLGSMYSYKGWQHGAVAAGGDQFGYYIYEPAAFIYHDLGDFNKTVAAVYDQGYYPRNNSNPLGITELAQTPTGHYSGKYTFGVAILQAPFFCMAHTYSLLTHHSADGFSPIYIFFNCLSGVFYSLIGLWVLTKVLLRYLPDGIVAITLLVIALATNLYFMQVSQGAMSHPYLFCLYAVMIYYMVLFFEAPSPLRIFMLAISCGFITLIRPNEIICVLLPLIYGAYTLGFKGFIDMITKRPVFLVLVALAFLLPIIPQLLFWKWVSGKFLFYSYGNEGFDFRHPHIWSGITSGHNGWLVYTPVMALSIIGMAWLWFKNRAWFYPIAAFMAVNVYITYSWWCWNYVNGFGSRPMVETYAVMALPLGYFIYWANKRWSTKISVAILLLFFVWLNLFQTYQQKIGILWSENASRTYVWNMIGKTTATRNNLIEYDVDESQPDTNRMVYKSTLLFNNMEDTSLQVHQDTLAWQGKYSYKLAQDDPYAFTINKTAKESDFKAGDWIKISAYCRNEEWNYDLYKQCQLVTEFLRPGKTKSLQWHTMNIQNKIGNPENIVWGFGMHQWGYVYYYTQVPKGIKEDDLLKFFAWNNGGLPVLIDDVKVEVYGVK